MNRRLRGKETMTIDDELISLRDTAKDSRIVENETRAIRSRSLMEKQSSRQAGEPATDYNAIVYFASFGYFRWNFVVLAVTHSMCAVDHRLGVAGSGVVVALSGIASPARTDFTGCLITKRKWTSASHQHASRRRQCAIEEIAPRNRLVQTKDIIEMRTPTHRDLPFSSFSRRRWGAHENFPIAYFLLSSVDTVCFRCLSFVVHVILRSSVLSSRKARRRFQENASVHGCPLDRTKMLRR